MRVGPGLVRWHFPPCSHLYTPKLLLPKSFSSKKGPVFYPCRLAAPCLLFFNISPFIEYLVPEPLTFITLH